MQKDKSNDEESKLFELLQRNPILLRGMKEDLLKMASEQRTELDGFQ